MWASAPCSVTSTTRPRIARCRYGLSGSRIASATLGVRRMLRSFTRPLAELMRRWLPSQSNQTGVTCGLPPGMTVARLANAFFWKRSLKLSGIVAAMRPPRRWLPGGGAQGRLRGFAKVVDIFDPHRQPDKAGTDPELGLLLGRQRPVGRPGRVAPRRGHVTKARGKLDQGQGREEALDGRGAPPPRTRRHAAEAVGEELPREPVLRVAREPRVVDAPDLGPPGEEAGQREGVGRGPLHPAGARARGRGEGRVEGERGVVPPGPLREPREVGQTEERVRDGLDEDGARRR